ncbi:protein phosphatase [Lithospermum erythrorhizon]|uniref:Protein phosphatase n=1 Tax=Lithospermum erythrorhizon TaxID=34254 RepID=A0AAV3QYM7_LITER
MVSKGEHQTVPLSLLLKHESENEKIDNPKLSHGEHGQSKKGEDFMMVKTHCHRVLADGVTTFSVYGCMLLNPHSSQST